MTNSLRGEIRTIRERVAGFPDRYHTLVLEYHDKRAYKLLHLETDRTGQEYTDGWPKPVVASVTIVKNRILWELYDNTQNWYVRKRVGMAFTKKGAERKAYQRIERIAQIASRRAHLPVTNRVSLQES